MLAELAFVLVIVALALPGLILTVMDLTAPRGSPKADSSRRHLARYPLHRPEANAVDGS